MCVCAVRCELRRREQDVSIERAVGLVADVTPVISVADARADKHKCRSFQSKAI